MCGRYTLRTSADKLAKQFSLDTTPDLFARNNIAPTQQVAAVRESEQVRELVMLRWGLVRSWAKDLSIGNKMINARAETVAVKPSFRAAFKRRRCLVLADGYYEWQKMGKEKQPYHIHMQDERPFAFAALWEKWQDPLRGKAVESCTIITNAANQRTEAIHDRMPVILDTEGCAQWLDERVQDRSMLESLLIPYEADDLVFDPVSTHVNKPKNDDLSCLEPA